MFIDGRLLESDTTLRADICVIGTGMGAISAASLLIHAGHDVLFIETGPLVASRRARSSVRIESVGRPFGLATSRGLELGGGTAFWHGVCAPLDEQDFLARPWIPHSGWPIGRDDLARWYAEAEQFLGRGHGDTGETVGFGSAVMRDTTVFDSKTYSYRSPPFRGKATLRDWCERGQARCAYHSTGLRLLHEHGRARTLLVGSGGRCFTVVANRFVIAAGALETPRLLLNSLRQPGATQPPSPWWLGRNLIDHPAGFLSQVVFHNRSDNVRIGGQNTVAKAQVFSGFLLKGETQRDYQLPNHAVFIRKGVSEQIVPTKALMSFLGLRGVRDVRLGHLAALVRHPYIAWRIAQEKLSLHTRSRYGDLFFMTEQLPNPNSQVSLSERERDDFGFPIARVNWHISELDISMFSRYHDLLMSRLLGHSDIHKLRVDPASLWDDVFASAAHHLGTARMAATADDGVVDSNLKVFGFDNVWVSDGSVFPTAGSVNPSLTISALGLRLGAHLNQLRS
jgi:choline dehydrogenase-like flavoprotein